MNNISATLGKIEVVNRNKDRDAIAIYALYGLLIFFQIVLVFEKSVNWDEFYHYSMVHDLPKGRLTWDLQTLHLRLFLWVPYVADDLITQIQIARLGMLCCEIVAVVMVVLLSREFVDGKTALVAGLVYLAGGFIFTQGFSFRADPIATAVLMTALYLFVSRTLSLGHLALVGVLVGLAGLMTIKSIFYAPCFIAFALRRLIDSDHRLETLARIAIIPIMSIITFVAILQLHRIGLDVREGAASSLGSRITAFLGTGRPGERAAYTVEQMLLAPIITLGVIVSAVAWKRIERRNVIALAGLLMPLLTLLFYRNTFPYYFVFLLAPVCVGISPSIALMLERYGVKKMLAVIAATPLFLLANQQYGVIDRQRALINEVHRLFPTPTGYLAYAGFIADYPRILPHLISGVGLQGYHDRGIPVIAQEIERGNVAFVLADSEPVIAALAGREMPNSLQPRDFVMLRENFVHYLGPIWIAGKNVCAAQGEQSIALYRSGPYTINGGNILIDGATVNDGATVQLGAGQRRIMHKSGGCITLWALPKTPHPPASYPDGPVMARF